MTTPSEFLFPMTAELRIMLDSTGEVEPILAEPIEVRCLLAQGLRRVETPDGREELSTTTAYCHPDTPDVPTGSRFTIGPTTYVVIRAMPWRFPGRPVESVELHLQ